MLNGNKTYGARPQSFTLDDSGERYYIGSEIGQYLKFHRGTLYKKYPQLWKRTATVEEKKKLQEMATTPAFLNTNIMLVKAAEIDELLSGQEEKFRSLGGASNVSRNDVGPSPLKPRASMGAGWLAAQKNTQVSSGSHHLESVPCSTPLAHARGRLRPRDGIPMDDTESIRRAVENAEQPEDLVPIRLDMELDGIKLRDVFCYNRSDSMTSPEQVAEALCEDLDLPTVSFLPAITAAIQQQLDASGESVLNDPMLTDQRAILKLNIHVGNQSLVDQFEWDMSEPQNSPEEFAQKLASELGLGGEFVAAIAYSIRGQLSWNQRTYAYSESPLPTVDCPFRNPSEADSWGPFLETLTDAEIEKKMRDQDRNTRRMRRLVYNPMGY